MATPTNSDEIIDSRDIIERIEEIHGEIDDADDRALLYPDADDLAEVQQELAALEALASEGEGYGDWEYGETLIREDYFETYAQELAEDIGPLPDQWPYSYIDWTAAAKALEQDYMTVTFDGVDYFMRA
jgi:hypothetical protein